MRIKQHLATHTDLIQDWAIAEEYCKEVAVQKRREADRERANDPKRKEVLRKADKKRADDPKRKQVLRKADKKRADEPKRKEVLRKADKKREPKRAD